MALFEPIPNYAWNRPTAIAMQHAGTPALIAKWTKMDDSFDRKVGI